LSTLLVANIGTSSGIGGDEPQGRQFEGIQARAGSNGDHVEIDLGHDERRDLLGQIITLLLPSIVAAAQAGNLSVGAVISQAIAGGAGGAIVTAIIGAIKNKAAA
jgi:hypothetical protein